jgi:hypothetical protein
MQKYVNSFIPTFTQRDISRNQPATNWVLAGFVEDNGFAQHFVT